MDRLIGWRKADDWGSSEAIPHFLGEVADGAPVSEVWFGDHPDGPTLVAGPGGTGDEGDSPALRTGGVPAGAETLRDRIGEDPRAALGSGVLYSFGEHLPFLVKLIAPAQALSLQVHPTKEIAREGYLREDVLGIARTDPQRTYRDMNHKPELVYALTDFEALVGFRVPRKARELLDDLHGPLAESLRRRLQLSTVRGGLRSLVAWLFDEDSPATPAEVEDFCARCQARLDQGTSPSSRTDQLVASLGRRFPGDPGIVVAFLMNPVSLRAGEVVYIPPRQIHSYQSGLGVEVMATSDNVIRAGLTRKYVDAAQLVDIAEFAAVPPIRLAPEHPTATTDRFLAPSQEFTLSVTEVGDGNGTVDVPGEGPRVVIAVDGTVRVSAQEASAALDLTRGEAAFVASSDRSLKASGHGTLVQCAVP